MTESTCPYCGVDGKKLEAEQAELVAALEPFAKAAFSRAHSGTVTGDASPIYQRDEEILTLGDFRRAYALLITLASLDAEEAKT